VGRDLIAALDAWKRFEGLPFGRALFSPKGMQVEYLRKAETDVEAIATLPTVVSPRKPR
jgi:hypothetical protein